MTNSMPRNLITFKIVFFLSFILVVGCTKSDPSTFEPDSNKRARENADKNPFFGLLGGSSNKNTTFEFGTSNVLWRATLKTLDFLPFANVDYSGGVIVTDWYSDTASREQIKINIRFLSNEVRADALEIIGHKKICSNFDNCITSKLDKNFNDQVKDSILNTARIMKIEEQKLKK